ncbi:threonine synthase, partial [Halolamina litorea]
GGPAPAEDDDILDTAVEIARAEGVEMGATCAAAAAGAFQLVDDGELGADDTVVLLNTGAGNKDVDTLRSHLGEREFEAETAE